MNESANRPTSSRPVSSTLVGTYNVYGSFQAELQVARAALEAGEYPRAIRSAHRAWEYYGRFVLVLLGRKAELDELRRLRRTVALHGSHARSYYEGETGDDRLSKHPTWPKISIYKSLRDEAEHEAEAG